MKFSLNFSIILALLVVLAACNAKATEIQCRFLNLDDEYTCQLFFQKIEDDESQNIVIVGSHLPGFDNSLVTRVTIMESELPFIITELFSTFPSFDVLFISSTNFTRIQPGAFVNAPNLTHMTIEYTLLREINARAFQGAVNLRYLQIDTNLESVHELAFVGLPNLELLELSGGSLASVAPKLFFPLASLQNINLANNRLESIDGEIFANNPLLRYINMRQNRIYAIGRNFLNGLTDLQIFRGSENQCVNHDWIIDGVSVTMETTQEGLKSCFVDPQPENEMRRFILEVSGPFGLLTENGTEIIRV